MVNILIFSNCHGALYKHIIFRLIDPNKYNIENILSYENLENFSNIKHKFSQCDILILQPIQSHEEFKIDNLKPILKPDCHVIVVPYIRFHGFWPSDDVRTLKQIASAAVVCFPKIYDESQVMPYIHGVDRDKNVILSNFSNSMNKFIELESLGDIKFVDFFKQNYKEIPLFRDPYHPTLPFLRYVTLQIIELLEECGVQLNKESFKMVSKSSFDQEYGHFKQIINRFAEVLGLKYDLDSYYVYSRYDFLSKILQIENTGDKYISDLDELKSYFDGEYAK